MSSCILLLSPSPSSLLLLLLDLPCSPTDALQQLFTARDHHQIHRDSLHACRVACVCVCAPCHQQHFTLPSLQHLSVSCSLSLSLLLLSSSISLGMKSLSDPRGGARCSCACLPASCVCVCECVCVCLFPCVALMHTSKRRHDDAITGR